MMELQNRTNVRPAQEVNKMSILNLFLALMLISVAALTAIVYEQNRKAELEARIELLRLVRAANRQSTRNAQTINVCQTEVSEYIENSGFFKLPLNSVVESVPDSIAA